MKVLHIQKVKGIGGSERHLLDLLPGLRAAGAEVSMCVLAGGGHGRFVAELKKRHVDVSVLPAGPDVNPILLERLARRMRIENPDVVHTHLIHADVHGQLTAWVSGIPAVSSIHGGSALRARPPFVWGARLAGRLAVRTIAISESLVRYVRASRLARPDRVSMIHYGVDASAWTSTPAERLVERRRLGLTTDDVVVGMASRLIRSKGHTILIDAVSAARRSEPRLRLLLAGDGPLRQDIEQMADRKLGDVARVLGFVDDMRLFMAACDIVAFPSLAGLGEGFGLAALEAMAAGRPVIASSTDSLPEIVLDGLTGCLAEPGVASDWSQRLTRLANDPGLRIQLGEAARARAEAEFSLDAMIRRTMDVYKDVLREPRTSHREP